jgi:hypothetical protein
MKTGIAFQAHGQDAELVVSALKYEGRRVA